MTTEEIIRLLVSLLGGGIAVALIHVLYSHFSTKRQREAERLSEQLRGLYGPLWFFTRQNAELLALINNLDDAYDLHFNQKWSDDVGTEQALRQQSTATMDLSNSYVRRVASNNEQVMLIMQRGWHLVDAEDVPVFARFQVDMARFTEEVEKDAGKHLPFSIYQALGGISYMRPTMIKHVSDAVARKNERLQQLGWSRVGIVSACARRDELG